MEKTLQNPIYFPSKQSMLKDIPFKKVEVHSNHYPITIHNTNFAEYYVKIFSTKFSDSFDPS